MIEFTSAIIGAWHLSVSYTHHHWVKTIKKIWIHNSLIHYSRMQFHFLHCIKYFILHFFPFLFLCISSEERGLYGACVCVCCRPWALEGKRKMRNYERQQMNKLEVTKKGWMMGAVIRKLECFPSGKKVTKILIHLFLNLNLQKVRVNLHIGPNKQAKMALGYKRKK